jgi:triosephosphate isomerase
MVVMRKDIIAGNWKMHATHLEAIQMVQKLSYRLDPADHERVDVVVVPPATALRSAQTVIETDHLAIELGAQNCHWEESGAFTGEVSAAMLAKLSVSHVLAGHSERRQLFGETDETVNKKVKAILANEMTPIMCVGETEAERDAGQTEAVLRTQVTGGLAGLDGDAVGGLVVAYEPVWAIGTGRTASPDDAAAGCGFIRSLVRERWGDAAADSVRIQYGGSVKPGNIAAIMAKTDIDGALVGGASLDPDTFASVVRYWI